MYYSENNCRFRHPTYGIFAFTAIGAGCPDTHRESRQTPAPQITMLTAITTAAREKPDIPKHCNSGKGAQLHREFEFNLFQKLANTALAWPAKEAGPPIPTISRLRSHKIRARAAPAKSQAPMDTCRFEGQHWPSLVGRAAIWTLDLGGCAHTCFRPAPLR